MFFVLISSLIACNKTPEPEPEVCDATLLAALPEDGEDVIGTNARVLLSVSGNVTEGGATLSTDPAVSYTATLSDGQVVFTPDQTLESGTTYTWTSTLCGAEVATGSFTPRGEGEWVPPDELPNRTFGMDLASATWVEPEGGGQLFSQLFGGILLVGVQSADESSIDTMGAVGEDVDGYRQQDPCYATVDFEPADFTRNPYVEIGPVEFPIEVQGQPATLHDLHFFGAFDVEGLSLRDASLRAQGDLRDVAPGSGYRQYCNLLATYGLSCTACVSDGTEACINLAVQDITGEILPGVAIQVVTDPGAECGPPDTGH